MKKAAVDVKGGSADDPRVVDLLGRGLVHGARPLAKLIGFPVDEGVRRNDGRTGAAAAPAAFRRAFYRLAPGDNTNLPSLLERTDDAGDIDVVGNLETDQAALAEVVGSCLAEGTLPIIVGGGHETAFGHFLGYVDAAQKPAILNWDAHPDVRPLVNGRGHSGSPFRQALLHPSESCRGYTVAGLLPYSVAAAHLEFVAEYGQYYWQRDLSPALIDEIFRSAATPTLVSFDLDAVNAADAPGVSAPATGGMPAGLWLHAAFVAGTTAAVTSVDLVELNPTYDEGGRTARLAAVTLWYFLEGLSLRLQRVSGT